MDVETEAGPSSHLSAQLLCYSQYKYVGQMSKTPELGPCSLTVLKTEPTAFIPCRETLPFPPDRSNDCLFQPNEVLGLVNMQDKSGQFMPSHLETEFSPLGWKSLADCTVFLLAIGLILSFRQTLIVPFFFTIEVIFVI